MAHKFDKGLLVSGMFNIVLGIFHQIMTIDQYSQISKFKTPETTRWITDLLLYSLGMGVILIFLGFFSCYAYYGIKNDEKWARVLAAGISLFLLSAVIMIIIVQGPGAFIFIVHFLNSLLIGIPLLVNRINQRNENMETLDRVAV